jgi:hypothetical protein
MEIKNRFESKYFVAPDGCWLWLDSLSRGYGQFYVETKNDKRVIVAAHRFSYELAKGFISDNLVIDHLCRQRSCVNPHHLEPVTSKENVLRGEGLPAINSQKTSCKRGHEFTEENTYVYKNMRSCRKCTYNKIRSFRDKKKIPSTLESLNS